MHLVSQYAERGHFACFQKACERSCSCVKLAQNFSNRCGLSQNLTLTIQEGDGVQVAGDSLAKLSVLDVTFI